jgi:hypothetical protein
MSFLDRFRKPKQQTEQQGGVIGGFPQMPDMPPYQPIALQPGTPPRQETVRYMTENEAMPKELIKEMWGYNPTQIAFSNIKSFGERQQIVWSLEQVRRIRLNYKPKYHLRHRLKFKEWEDDLMLQNTVNMAASKAENMKHEDRMVSAYNIVETKVQVPQQNFEKKKTGIFGI